MRRLEAGEAEGHSEGWGGAGCRYSVVLTAELFPLLQLFKGYLLSRGFQSTNQSQEAVGSENETKRRKSRLLREETEKEG